MILACSPININELQNQSGNISYSEDIKALISNNDSQINGIKRKLNMNKDIINDYKRIDLDD